MEIYIKTMDIFTIQSLASFLNSELVGGIIRGTRRLRSGLDIGLPGRFISFVRSEGINLLWIDNGKIPKGGGPISSINGLRIQSIRAVDNDRIIVFEMESDYKIIFELFGTNANVVTVKNGNIVDILWPEIKGTGDRLIVNTPYVFPSPIEIQSIRPKPETKAEEILKQYLPQATAPIRHAILEVLELSPEQIIHSSELKSLITRIDEFKEKSVEPKSEATLFEYNAKLYLVPFITKGELLPDKKTGFKTHALKTIKSHVEKKRAEFYEKEIEKKKKELKKAVRNTVNQIRQSISRKKLRQNADILMAYANRVPSKAESVKLPDLYSERTVEIFLDPSKDAYGNANELYEKAKKAERSIPILARRYRELYIDLRNLDIREIDVSYPNDPVKKTLKKQPKPWREFHSSDGFDILVGKSASSNDKLVFEESALEDLWFHAQGVPGSHVIIRLAGKKAVSRAALKLASGLAIYYSKARNSSKAPVVYCERRYVHRISGQTGKVRLDKYKTIMVFPPGRDFITKFRK